MKYLVLIATLLIMSGCKSAFLDAKAKAIAEKICNGVDNVHKVKTTLFGDAFVYCTNGKLEYVSYNKLDSYTSPNVKKYLKQGK